MEIWGKQRRVKDRLKPEDCQFLLHCGAVENPLFPPVGVLPPGSINLLRVFVDNPILTQGSHGNSPASCWIRFLIGGHDLGPLEFSDLGGKEKKKRRPSLYNHPDDLNQYFGVELALADQSLWPNTV